MRWPLITFFQCILYQNVRGINKKCEEITDIMTTKKSSIFAASETFMKSDDPPVRLDKGYTWIGKSRRNGQSGGGVGFIVKSDNDNISILNDNLLSCKSDDKERLWILASINGIKTALGVVYFPQDGKDKALTDELCFTLLDDIGALQNKEYEIVLMGDFNGKCLRQCQFSGKAILENNTSSHNGKRLCQLLEASNLKMANLHGNCKGFYTRVHNDQQSAIDYMLLSPSIYDRTKEVHIDEEGSFDIESDHVLMSLIFCTKRQNRTNISHIPQSVWNVNDLTDWDCFSENLRNGLGSREVNASSSIDANWLQFKNIVNDTAEQTIGKKKIPKNYKSFWDKDIKRLIHERREINRLNRKISSESFLKGEIENLYKERKERVKHAIKQKRLEHERKSFISKLSKSKNKSKAFWQFIKGNNVKPQPPSHLIDPGNNETVLETNHDISESLQKHFGNIGKDCTVPQFNKDSIQNELNEIKRNMDKNPEMSSIKITKHAIASQLRKLKLGKSSGIDDIPNEFLKYGGEPMIHALTNLFIYISDTETIPEEWRNGIIKPIHKAGSINNIDNYRGITLSSNVYKLYTKIIENVIMTYIEENSVLHENPGAFRKNRRLEDNIFTLNGFCSTRKLEGTYTYLAFLDMSKAFDRVWRDGLFYLLWKFGVKGKIWRLICEMYKHVTNKVLFGGFQSDWFEQEYGVK